MKNMIKLKIHSSALRPAHIREFFPDCIIKARSTNGTVILAVLFVVYFTIKASTTKQQKLIKIPPVLP